MAEPDEKLQRKRFERSVLKSGFHKRQLERDPDLNGYYQDQYVQALWRGWWTGAKENARLDRQK